MALGHHKRDADGNPLSRAHETRAYRLKYPGRRKRWDATYRQSDAGEMAHQKYNDSEKGKSGHLQKAYGKTFAEKQAQYEAQKGICTLCEEPLPENLRWCFWDHNHMTHQMRDLLHNKCNNIVGWVEHELHEKALAYVERHAHVQS